MAAQVLKNTNIQKPRLGCLKRRLSTWFAWLKNRLKFGSSSGVKRIADFQRYGSELRGGSNFMHGRDHTNDFDTAIKYFSDIDFDELDWINDTDVGSSSEIPPTLQDSQNENNIVLESLEAENYINYNAVEQNNNIMIQHVPQIESNIANKSYEEKDNIFLDPTCISSNTTLDQVDNQRTSKISISLEVLQRHYKMSMLDAAKNLDVSVSTLKRICRQNGIERWPNCRKRKNINHEQRPNPKNVNKIVQNKNDNDNDNRNVTIKATYGDDIVKFPFSISSGLDDLKEKVCKWLNIDIQIKLKCKDDDGDLVLIACDDALREIFGRRLSRLVDHNTAFEFSVSRDTISDI